MSKGRVKCVAQGGQPKRRVNIEFFDFLVASIHKVADPDGFSKIIAGYKVVPSVLVGWVALFLPWLEINMALAILIPRARTAALVMGAGLLIVFAVLTGWNLLQGNMVPCGCFSNEGEPATWWSVARNMMLATIALRFMGVNVVSRKNPSPNKGAGFRMVRVNGIGSPS